MTQTEVKDVVEAVIWRDKPTVEGWYWVWRAEWQSLSIERWELVKWVKYPANWMPRSIGSCARRHDHDYTEGVMFFGPVVPPTLPLPGMKVTP